MFLYLVNNVIVLCNKFKFIKNRKKVVYVDYLLGVFLFVVKLEG